MSKTDNLYAIAMRESVARRLNEGPPTADTMKLIARLLLVEGRTSQASTTSMTMVDHFAEDQSDRGHREFYFWIGFSNASSASNACDAARRGF